MESDCHDATPFSPDQDAASSAPAMPQTAAKTPRKTRKPADLKASSWYERARLSIGARSTRD
jgi:hypothetical protein